MKIIRAIEEYRKRDNFLNKEYILDITAERILKILDDFTLYEEDPKLYFQYYLTQSQVKRLKSFLKKGVVLNEDFEEYIYQLACYDDVEKFEYKNFEKVLSIEEYDINTRILQKKYELNTFPDQIKNILPDLYIDECDEEMEDGYELTQSQVKRLKSFLKKGVVLNENFQKNDYYLRNWRK